MEWVAQELRNPTTNALVLFGQRRIGKTSLLLNLKQLLPADAFLPLYFDLQDQAKRPLSQVLADLADAVTTQMGMAIRGLDALDSEGRFFQHTFLPQVYKRLGGHRRLVFLLDEFDVLDQITQNELSEMAAANALFPFLRRIMNTDPYPAFVFVVGRRAEDMSLDFVSTFKTSLMREVWVLDKASAEALIRQAETKGSLRFTDQGVARILNLASGHPYFTQLLCQRIWERAYARNVAAPPAIDISEVDAAVADALEAGGQALIWLWEGLTPAERIYAAALAEAAQERETILEDQVIDVLTSLATRLRTRDIESARQDLVKRRVLEIVGKHEYRFAVDLFRLWVREHKPLRDVKDELDRIEPVADGLYDVGWRYFNQRKWGDAVRHFREALQANPNHFRAQLYLGEALLELTQIDEAVAELERAYELDHDEARLPLARAFVIQAQSREKAGDEDGALAASERALRVSLNERLAQEVRARIWTRRGDAALEQDDLDAALAAYQRAGAQEKIMEVRQRRQDILEREAIAYEAMGQWAMAIAAYRRLLNKTEDENLRSIWEKALAQAEERFRDESSKARAGSWLPDHILDNRYRIVGQIGTTQRCEIYLAEELQPPRDTVVVKRLKPDKISDVDARERFEWEVTVLRRIHHPAVLSIFDIQIGGGDYYFVTEFADRGSLKDYAATKSDHKLEPTEALVIAISICQGLEAAHRERIIHRDVKPANILLFSQTDGSITAKLADFSIARIPDRRLTQTGWFMGTPLYASPEQLSAGLVDARSDIYSWALAFFEMVTGKVLKESFIDGSNYLSAIPDVFPETFFMENSVPQQFVAVLQKALHKDPGLRYRSAQEVLAELELIKREISRRGEEPGDLKGPLRDQTRWAEVRAWFERQSPKIAALLAVLLILTFAIWQPWQAGGFVTATATPTPTGQATLPSSTPTLPVTATASSTLTTTPTPSFSPTTTPTGTRPTATRTPSRTASATSSATPSVPPATMPTQTRTLTPTVTPATPRVTPTVTPATPRVPP
jgi:serine/threonine protein kinase